MPYVKIKNKHAYRYPLEKKQNKNTKTQKLMPFMEWTEPLAHLQQAEHFTTTKPSFLQQIDAIGSRNYDGNLQ